ncbi:hypothetical protein [Nonomuraea sp. NPDC052265]|uniref:hypothetical protein n=1 Tax=Nonomuraea sp. NPDC052265 TaxID=3364374 RepID=UPI0037CBA8A9
MQESASAEQEPESDPRLTLDRLGPRAVRASVRERVRLFRLLREAGPGVRAGLVATGAVMTVTPVISALAAGALVAGVEAGAGPADLAPSLAALGGSVLVGLVGGSLADLFGASAVRAIDGSVRSMRWRGKALDVLLVTAAVGFDVLTTWHTWGTSSAPVVICAGFSVLAGAPLGFVRRWPVPVVGYLAGLLVLTDQIGAFTVNTVQILLMAALGVVAHRARPLAVLCSAVVAGAATGVNLADPGQPFTVNAWLYCAGAAVVPVLIGAYLRGPAGRLAERDITVDVLLAGGGLTLAVLDTWTAWDAAGGPVWVAGSLVALAGLSLGVARRLPGLVFVLQVALMLLADQYFQEAMTTCVMLVLVTVGVFAMRVASWGWTFAVYLVAVLSVAAFTAAVRVAGPGSEVQPMYVLVLMTLVVAPVAIGRYLQARQAASEAERLRLRESRQRAVAQDWPSRCATAARRPPCSGCPPPVRGCGACANAPTPWAAR